MPIFVLSVSAGVSFDGAFSLWVSLTCSSPQILGKVQTGIFSSSRFPVRSLINKNFHNFKTSYNIDKTSTTNLVREKWWSQKTDDDIKLVSYDYVTVIFYVQGWFGVTWKPKSGCMFYDFYLTKIENRTKKSLSQLLYHFFEKCTIFARNCWLSVIKILRSAILMGPLHY